MSFTRKYPVAALRPLFALLPASLMLVACGSTPEPESRGSYASLPVSEAELLKPQWQALTRFAPKYPVEEAIKGQSGCATVEYVILPDYQLADIQVIHASSSHFANEAVQQLRRWKWQQLPAALIAAPVKTSTRFEYCMSAGQAADNSCQPALLAKNTQCPGDDVQISIGQKL